MTSEWTKREIAVLEALTLKVRTLTAQQLATGWWGGVEHVEEAERSLQPLCKVGLLERMQVYAHPIISIAPPAFHWKPGDEHPTDEKINELAGFFQGRWNQPEQTHVVYVASRRAANLFGSYVVEPPSTEQWTHDIHVSEIYIDMLKRNTPEEMELVIGEGALPKLGKDIKFMKDPDLFVVDRKEQAEMVIEFAGAYDAKHIRELHEHCSGGAYEKLKKRFGNRQHRLYPSPEGTEYVLV